MKTTSHTAASTTSPINTMTGWHPILRPVARLVLVAQLAGLLQPLSILAQEKGQLPYNPVAQAELERLGKFSQDMQRAKAQAAKDKAAPADQVSDHLKQADELVKSLTKPPANVPGAPSSSSPSFTFTSSQRADQIGQLKTHLAAIDQGAASVQAEFDATRASLKAKNLSADILARHDAAVAQFQQRSKDFANIAHKISNATTVADADIKALGAFFDAYPTSRKPAPLVPGKLPWSTPKPNTRAPAVTKTGWFNNFYSDQKVQLAQAGGNIGPIHFNIPPVPGQTPTVADLAETDEVQITAGIRAKATELGNNPVNIYNWVRNNIEFAPTAGAIQSAQDTLDKLRGNATDTASLLIALLRAANIPARYQYGTIDIPADKVQNWVGGTTNPEAALQILNMGGIAATGLASGGHISTIRMEHVWVNAYVNWRPSQGAKDGGANMVPPQHVNPNGNLNAWVAMDGSFKQYTYRAGMDLKNNVPLDANALLAAAQQGATVNAAQGWVQNLNQAAIQSQLSAYQTQLKNYINSTSTGTNSTVGDVIGKKVIPQQAQPLLVGNLQNAIVVSRASEVSAVPAAMQHKFTYSLYASQSDQASGNAMLSFTEKTSKLVGKRLTLTYVPATQADADIIDSYIPQPHSTGSPVLLGEMPTSLPGYLIKLRPQISLDGQVVATSGTGVQMGADLYSSGGFTQLNDTSQWDLTNDESNVAGNGTAIGVSAGGVSVAQMVALKNRLSATQAQLNAQNVVGVKGEQISGDILTAAIWGWFAATMDRSHLIQRSADIIENSGLSYGLLHAVARPSYSWGIINRVTYPGVNIDVGHVRNISWAINNNSQSWVNYNRIEGQLMSGLEAVVPEHFFNDPAQCNPVGVSSSGSTLPTCPQGISAVKAISLGAQAGQKILTITAQVYQNNPNIVNMSLSAHSQSTQDRVQQALDAGYEVTIHDAPITQDGWTGAGFTVIDPSTGAGGYIIDGGSNGGMLMVVGLIISFLGVLLMGTPSALAGALILAAGQLIFFAGLSIYNSHGNEVQCVFLLSSGIGLLIGALGLLSLPLGVAANINGVLSALLGAFFTNFESVSGTIGMLCGVES